MSARPPEDIRSRQRQDRRDESPRDRQIREQEQFRQERRIRQETAEELGDEFEHETLDPEDIIIDDGRVTVDPDVVEAEQASRERAAERRAERQRQQFLEEQAEELDADLEDVDVTVDDLDIEDDRLVVADDLQEAFERRQLERRAGEFDEELPDVEVDRDDLVVKDGTVGVREELIEEQQAIERRRELEDAAEDFDEQLPDVDIEPDDLILEDDTITIDPDLVDEQRTTDLEAGREAAAEEFDERFPEVRITEEDIEARDGEFVLEEDTVEQVFEARGMFEIPTQEVDRVGVGPTPTIDRTEPDPTPTERRVEDPTAMDVTPGRFAAEVEGLAAEDIETVQTREIRAADVFGGDLPRDPTQPTADVVPGPDADAVVLEPELTAEAEERLLIEQVTGEFDVDADDAEIDLEAGVARFEPESLEGVDIDPGPHPFMQLPGAERVAGAVPEPLRDISEALREEQIRGRVREVELAERIRTETSEIAEEIGVAEPVTEAVGRVRDPVETGVETVRTEFAIPAADMAEETLDERIAPAAERGVDVTMDAIDETRDLSDRLTIQTEDELLTGTPPVAPAPARAVRAGRLARDIDRRDIAIGAGAVAGMVGIDRLRDEPVLDQPEVPVQEVDRTEIAIGDEPLFDAPEIPVQDRVDRTEIPVDDRPLADQTEVPIPDEPIGESDLTAIRAQQLLIGEEQVIEDDLEDQRLIDEFVNGDLTNGRREDIDEFREFTPSPLPEELQREQFAEPDIPVVERDVDPTVIDQPTVEPADPAADFDIDIDLPGMIDTVGEPGVGPQQPVPGIGLDDVTASTLLDEAVGQQDMVSRGATRTELLTREATTPTLDVDLVTQPDVATDVIPRLDAMQMTDLAQLPATGLAQIPAVEAVTQQAITAQPVAQPTVTDPVAFEPGFGITTPAPGPRVPDMIDLDTIDDVPDDQRRRRRREEFIFDTEIDPLDLDLEGFDGS